MSTKPQLPVRVRGDVFKIQFFRSLWVQFWGIRRRGSVNFPAFSSSTSTLSQIVVAPFQNLSIDEFEKPAARVANFVLVFTPRSNFGSGALWGHFEPF